MKTIVEHGKQLVKSNAIIKKYDHDTENNYDDLTFHYKGKENT